MVYFGGDECQSLKLDGFALLMHKLGKSQLNAASQPDLVLANHVHQFDAN